MNEQSPAQLGTLETSALLALLEQAPREERLAAVRELARRREVGCVGLLVRLLGQEDHDLAGEAGLALAAIGGREVASQLMPLLSAEQVGLRNLAIELLRQVGGDAPDLLLNLLEISDADLRIFAADILGSVHASGVSKALLQALGDPDPNLRAVAAASLGRRKDLSAVPALLHLLTDEDWVAYGAVEALAAIGDPSCCEYLLKALPTCTPLVQNAIAQALGSLADLRAAPSLLQALARAQGGLATLLVVALLRAGGADAFQDLSQDLQERVVLGLLDALDDPAEQVRLDALNILARLGNPSCIYALLNLAAREKNGRVAAQVVETLVAVGEAAPLVGALREPSPHLAGVAARVLGRLGGPLALEALIQARSHPEAGVRAMVAGGLGQLGQTRALDALLDLLHDGQEQVRLEALAALGRLADPRSAHALEAVLQEGPASLRPAALEALRGLGGLLAGQALGRCLGGQDGELRLLAAQALAQGGASREQAPALESLLADDQPGVRAAAAQALLAARAGEEMPFLETMLGDPEAQVRLALVSCLDHGCHPTAQDLLLKALDDAESAVRKRAAEQLGCLRLRRAVPALLKLLGSQEGLLRVAGLAALGAIGDPATLDPVFSQLAHPDPRVRAAASQAILEIEGSPA